MPIIKHYKCDKCGEEKINEANFLLPVRVLVGENFNDRDTYEASSALWCRECLRKARIVPQWKRKDMPEEEKPTIESMIRELVQKEVSR